MDLQRVPRQRRRAQDLPPGPPRGRRRHHRQGRRHHQAAARVQRSEEAGHQRRRAQQHGPCFRPDGQHHRLPEGVPGRDQGGEQAGPGAQRGGVVRRLGGIDSSCVQRLGGQRFRCRLGLERLERQLGLEQQLERRLGPQQPWPEQRWPGPEHSRAGRVGDAPLRPGGLTRLRDELHCAQESHRRPHWPRRPERPEGQGKDQRRHLHPADSR
mmetsp:Transcript_47354/g.127789  ORF Transcript_47354/g.127789 Transcript_47354/m.127789 type:complete len:212 (-) Transcript_47354:241-876(-)